MFRITKGGLGFFFFLFFFLRSGKYSHNHTQNVGPRFNSYKGVIHVLTPKGGSHVISKSEPHVHVVIPKGGPTL